MTVSSRTPEGFPARCPLCGAATDLEYSEPAGDAPCPNCGHLLWSSAQLLETIQRQIGGSLNVARGKLGAGTAFKELGADSLDTVELLMEIQEEFGVTIPDDVAERIQTIGDLVRYIQAQRGGGDAPA